jgi:pimeloyl-ACP methyl ester carboxylesterase
MSSWLRTRLRTVFHAGKAAPRSWNNLHLVGNGQQVPGVISYSGLTANGAISQRRSAKQLHRHFHGQYDVWQRNLFGHTGRYGDFRRSRMWDWIADGCRVISDMLDRNRSTRIFLIGESTGALVVIVAAALFGLFRRLRRFRILQRPLVSKAVARCCSSCFLARYFPRTKQLLRLFRAAGKSADIGGVVLLVPAFRLSSRRNEVLLLSTLLLYYVLAPLGQLATGFVQPSLWPALLFNQLLIWIVFPRIWVPSGNAFVAVHQPPPGRNTELLLAGSCFFIGLYPAVSTLVCLCWNRHALLSLQMLFSVALLLPLVVIPRGRNGNGGKNGNGHERKAKGGDDSETADSTGYFWLPVVTTATLFPLQWLALWAVRRLDCPLLFIFAAKDEVIDNLTGARCFGRLSTADKTEIWLDGHLHTDWSQTQRDAYVAELCRWLEPRLSR